MSKAKKIRDIALKQEKIAIELHWEVVGRWNTELRAKLAKAEALLKDYKKKHVNCLPSEQETCDCLNCKIGRYFAENEEAK